MISAELYVRSIPSWSHKTVLLMTIIAAVTCRNPGLMLHHSKMYLFLWREKKKKRKQENFQLPDNFDQLIGKSARIINIPASFTSIVFEWVVHLFNIISLLVCSRVVFIQHFLLTVNTPTSPMTRGHKSRKNKRFDNS